MAKARQTRRFSSFFRKFVEGWTLPERRNGSRSAIGSRQGICVSLAIHRAASCTTNTQALPGSPASRPGGGTHARPRHRPRIQHPACSTGGLPPTPMAARDRRSYELPRLRLGAAPCGTIPRIAVPGPLVSGPASQGRKSWARTVGPCLCPALRASATGPPGIQLPLLRMSGT